MNQPNINIADKNQNIKFYESKAKDNNPILIVEKNGNPVYLFSKYNPVKEGERQAANITINEEHIVIIGGGSPYFLKELLNNIDKNKRVFYIEPYPELFAFVVKYLKLDNIINSFDYFTITSPQNPDFDSDIQKGVDIVKLDKIDYIVHPIADRIFKQEIDQIIEKVNKAALQIVYDFVTRMKDGRRVQKNILSNINYIINSPSINKLKNLFTDIPSIIVSAGPSLDKNLPYIKDMERKGIIISTDTALKPLLSANIEPHFVVAGDPSYFNYLHLKGVASDKTYLITEPSVDTRVFKDFKNKVFITIFDKPLLELIEKYIGEITHLNTWGTVASLALELARFIGSSPVFFIGQDFSFPYNIKYTRKTIYDNDWIYSRDNITFMNNKRNSLINLKSKIDTFDIFNRKVITDHKLENYKDYVQTLIDKNKKYLNITEGGIFKSVKNSFAWFEIQKLDYKTRDFYKDIDKIHSLSKTKENRKKTENFLKSFIKYLQNINIKIKDNLDLIYNNKVISEENLSKAYNELYANESLAEIIENYTQEPIYQLLKDKNRYKKTGDFFYLKDSYKQYYEKLLSLTQEIIDDFNEALEIIKNKKEVKK